MTIQRSTRYWERRALERQKAYEIKLSQYEAMIRRDYDRSFKYIDSDIQNIIDNYQRYTKKRFDVTLTRSQAREFLNAPLNETTYQKLIDEWQKRGIDVTEMINRTGNYSARITNKQAIRSSISQEMNQLAGKEIQLNKIAYRDLIREAGDRLLYDTSLGTGLDLSMNRLNSKEIEQIMKTKWSGEMFSNRVWNNTKVLENKLKSLFTVQQLSNRPTSALQNELNELSSVGKYASARLVRTESNAMRSLTEQHVSEKLGIEKFRIVAALDNRTSAICQEKDLSIGLWKDAVVGEDIPPFHPNCRSIAVDHFDDMDYSKLERVARDPNTGQIQRIPANTTYQQWQGQSPIISGEVSNTRKPFETIAEVEKALQDKGVKLGNSLEKMDPKLYLDNANELNELLETYPKSQEYIRSNQFTFDAAERRARVHGSCGHNIDISEQRISLNRIEFGNYDNVVNSAISEAASGFKMPLDPSKAYGYTLNHEFGHLIQNILVKDIFDKNPEELIKLKEAVFRQSSTSRMRKYLNDYYLKKARVMKDDIIKIAKDMNKDFSLDLELSQYGRTNNAEFFAECFANARSGRPNTLGKAILKYLDEVFR